MPTTILGTIVKQYTKGDMVSPSCPLKKLEPMGDRHKPNNHPQNLKLLHCYEGKVIGYMRLIRERFSLV